MKVIEIEVVKPMKIGWECPECGREQTRDIYYMQDEIRLQCDFCGKQVIGVV